MIGIRDFNDLLEFFDIVLAEGLQSTVASIGINAVVCCYLECFPCKLSIELTGVGLAYFDGKLKGNIRKQVNAYIFAVFFEGIGVKLLDGILLIKNEGETSVIDNVANAVNVVLLSCFIEHYLEERFAIWFSLNGQLFINSHKLSRNYYVLAHLQRNNSVVVDKIVLPDH